MERGLKDTYNIYEITGSDSGYGTETKTATLAVSNLKGRKTIKYLDRNEGIQLPQGVDMEKLWRFTLDYTSSLDESKTYKLSRMSGGSAVESFDVHWWQPQRDAQGVYHHISMVAELI